MHDNHLRRTGIAAGMAVVLGLVTWAHAAATIDAQGAARLLERGNLGLAAIVVLGVLAPIGVTVGAACFLIRRVVTMFAAQLTAQQAERENMADAHRLERQEAMRSERDDRDKQSAERERMCLGHQRHDEAGLQALQALNTGIAALVKRANGGE